MFETWKKRRELKYKIKEAERELDALDAFSAVSKDLAVKSRFFELKETIRCSHNKLWEIQTEKLLSKVTKRGIELPKDKKHWWWNDLDYVDPDDVTYYLTDIGQAGVAKILRDERKKNIEWWAKIVGTFITLLTGLAGAIIGILAIIYK